MNYLIPTKAPSYNTVTVDAQLVYAEIITETTDKVTRVFKLQAESELQAYFLIMSDAQEQHIHIITEQAEPLSRVKLTILQRASRDARIFITYTSKQDAHETQNDMHVHSLVCDQAQVSFTGLMHVSTKAAYIKAEQQSSVLLWSPHARAHSTPALEIERHDVSCTHGTSISSVRDEQLLYAAARGIPAHEARELIKEHFLYEFFEKHCTDIRVRDYMRPYMVDNS